jgi:hypothetical protein
MVVTVFFFDASSSLFKKIDEGMWSEAAMAQAIVEWSLVTAAKQFAVPRNYWDWKSSEYGDDDNRILVAYKRKSA